MKLSKQENVPEDLIQEWKKLIQKLDDEDIEDDLILELFKMNCTITPHIGPGHIGLTQIGPNPNCLNIHCNWPMICLMRKRDVNWPCSSLKIRIRQLR